MKNIMLDLETMGTGNNAAIVAIGAVSFDPFAEKIDLIAGDRSFYQTIDLQSSINAGMDVSGDTIMWWMQQSDAARQALKANTTTLLTGIGLFFDFVRGVSGENDKNIAMWGNGATFDNVIIRSAFKAVGIRIPWSFRNDICYRTIKNLVPSAQQPAWNRVGVAHNALDDAATQALHIQKIYKILGIKR